MPTTVYGGRKELGAKVRGGCRHTATSRLQRADDIDMTVATQTYALVKEIVEEREFDLIEALAATIGDEVLAGYPVSRATVRVRKPNAPLGGPADYVECEISRSAPGGGQPGCGCEDDAGEGEADL